MANGYDDESFSAFISSNNSLSLFRKIDVECCHVESVEGRRLPRLSEQIARCERCDIEEEVPPSFKYFADFLTPSRMWSRKSRSFANKHEFMYF